MDRARSVLTGWPSLSRQVIVGAWLISGGGPSSSSAAENGTSTCKCRCGDHLLPQKLAAQQFEVCSRRVAEAVTPPGGAPSAVRRNWLGGPVPSKARSQKARSGRSLICLHGCLHPTSDTPIARALLTSAGLSPPRTPLCRRSFAHCVARRMPSRALGCAARRPAPLAMVWPANRLPSGTAITAGASYGRLICGPRQGARTPALS